MNTDLTASDWVFGSLPILSSITGRETVEWFSDFPFHMPLMFQCKFRRLYMKIKVNKTESPEVYPGELCDEYEKNS